MYLCSKRGPELCTHFVGRQDNGDFRFEYKRLSLERATRLSTATESWRVCVISGFRRRVNEIFALSCLQYTREGINARILYWTRFNHCLSQYYSTFWNNNINIITVFKWAGIAQSVWRLATSWTVRGSNPGGSPNRPWDLPSLLYRG